jgi:hypothetical protein
VNRRRWRRSQPNLLERELAARQGLLEAQRRLSEARRFAADVDQAQAQVEDLGRRNGFAALVVESFRRRGS